MWGISWVWKQILADNRWGDGISVISWRRVRLQCWWTGNKMLYFEEKSHHNSLTSTSELFSRETHQATWFTIWETAAGCYFRSLHNRKWTNHNNLLVCPLRTSIPSHLPLFPNLMEKEISQCFPHSDFPTLKGNNLLFQEWVTIGSEATTMAEVKE